METPKPSMMLVMIGELFLRKERTKNESSSDELFEISVHERCSRDDRADCDDESADEHALTSAKTIDGRTDEG